MENCYCKPSLYACGSCSSEISVKLFEPQSLDPNAPAYNLSVFVFYSNHSKMLDKTHSAASGKCTLVLCFAFSKQLPGEFILILSAYYMITGMLVMGCILGNVPYINVARQIDPGWSSALR